MGVAKGSPAKLVKVLCLSIGGMLQDWYSIEGLAAVLCFFLLCRARQQTETGRVVNLMSNDVNNVMQVTLTSTASVGPDASWLL